MEAWGFVDDRDLESFTGIRAVRPAITSAASLSASAKCWARAASGMGFLVPGSHPPEQL